MTGVIYIPADDQELVLIDRTAGTNIGDMTENGGLAASFDGVTDQADTSGSTQVGVTTVFIGKTLAAAKVFGQAKIYGSNNSGFVNGANPGMTINIRGKSGAAPSGPTDGTIIGTTTFTDTADESAGRTISSTDITTSWDHLFAQISHDTSAAAMHSAELELWEWI